MKIWRDTRGSVSVEALFVIAILVMLLFFTIEMGFMMYDWAVVNHAASVAAVESAMTGHFSTDLRQATANHVKNWTTDGDAMSVSYSGTSPPGSISPNTIYIYGTDASTNVQRGNMINVGITYPFKFRTFVLDALNQWTTGDSQVNLRVNMQAASEVFFE